MDVREKIIKREERGRKIKTYEWKENEQKKCRNRREIGSRYESIAASYLEQQGYQICEQNYRTRTGEIDLIAVEKGTLVFVEVKYRTDLKKGDPFSAVGKKKQIQICKTALIYLMEKKIATSQPCRFDVVGILGENVTLIRNAFEFYTGKS